ncbi:hypothetical protein KFE25_000644 [Diacronema lutheri]|uniref:Uncharacterized protein n=1 Tax=Diacronema lutheri TaxID=2081491 RepID=A0A8J5XHE5_DIALT|nr:hypothetical protein KFE25_000644 [Diacronema lutheri]
MRTLGRALLLAVTFAAATSLDAGAPAPRRAAPRRPAHVRRAAARLALSPLGGASDALPPAGGLMNAMLGGAWDNRTAVDACDALDRLARGSSSRLAALGSGAPPPPPPPARVRSALDTAAFAPASAAAAAAADADADALLERARQRRAGELEAENAKEIATTLKMAALWPTPTGRLSELLRIEPLMSRTTSLGRRYHALLADAYEALGQRERARGVRRLAGLAVDGSAPMVGLGEIEPGANPEMSKLFSSGGDPLN